MGAASRHKVLSFPSQRTVHCWPVTLETKSRDASDSAALRFFAPTLILLVIALLINYVDRGNLALAAPLLKIDWGMTASQLGILLSAFFWTYTALQFVMG